MPAIQHTRVSTYCPPPPFRATGCGFFVRGHMFVRGPPPLDTATPVKGVQIQERAECPCRYRLMATISLSRHMRATHPDTHTPHDMGVNGRCGQRALRQQRCPETGPAIQWWAHCTHAPSSTAGTMYDIPTRHAEARRARVIDETGVEKSMLASPTVQEREMRGTSHIWSGGLTGHRCEKHGESTPNHTIGPSRLPCGESPRHAMECRGLKRPPREAQHTGRAPGLRGP